MFQSQDLVNDLCYFVYSPPHDEVFITKSFAALVEINNFCVFIYQNWRSVSVFIVDRCFVVF